VRVKFNSSASATNICNWRISIRSEIEIIAMHAIYWTAHESPCRLTA